MNPNKPPVDDLETTDPLQARRFEQELAARGVSYKTEIIKTKKEGLRYVVKLLGSENVGQ